ncbi:ATP-binding protein [Natronobiforma cellulositropha]|uniref:ATP-binding protein n=1 Tax=Natronobiforma cellulositropha TaxID=1679076 RepID=UPI0021D609C5|nr:ATP-binding protein [Natronobiforma cellulositropha]
MSSIKQPNGSLCPHYFDIDEELLSQLSSKVAKVRSEDKELFDFTHHRITVFDALAEDEVEISEEEIYEQFDRYRPKNFVTVIEGNVGTGKSELCAYLSHQLQDDRRPVLHIDKNADLLTIMAEEIPQFYREHIGGELPGVSNVERLQKHVRQNRDTVASLVVAKAILNITDLDHTDVNLTTGEREQLEEFVRKKLTAISQRGDLATKVSFVDPGEIETFSYLNVFEQKLLEEAAEAWNDAIWEAVRDEYDTPSLDQLLKRVGQDFGEDRPVLVFEDFSISALDAAKLRDFMEDDSTENNWDFIIAGTQDSTEILHTQTGLERHKFYRTNRPNSSRVLFLDEDSCVNFIRPYLGYIKHGDGSVSYKRDETNAIIDVESPATDSVCERCGFCDDSFRDLFPFNEGFLRQIYHGLDDDDQRPRQYVQKVFNVLEDYLEEFVDSPASSDELNGLHNSRTVHDDIYSKEPVRQLAKWHGEENKELDILVVDARFPQAFGFGKNLVDGLPIERQTVSPDHGNKREAWIIPKTKQQKKQKRKKKKQRAKPDPEVKKIEEVKGYLDTWRENTDARVAADLDVYMRTALKDALDELTEGFVLQSDGEIEYLIGGNNDPFVLEGQGIRNRDQIKIDPADFTTSDLLALLRYGVYREMRPQQADEAALFDKVGTQLTGYAREWRSTIRTEYLEANPNLFVRSARHNKFEDLIVALCGVAAMLDDPWKEVTADRIQDAYSADKLTLDGDLKNILEDRLVQEKQDDITAFMHKSEYIQGLVGDYFAASDSVLDLQRVQEHLSEAPPTEVLDNLKKSGIQNLPSKLRFDSNTSVKNLASAGYNVADALDMVAGDEDAPAAASFLNHQLRGINILNAKEYIENIRTYDDVSPDTKEILGKFTIYSQNDIHEVLGACTLQRDLSERRGTHALIHGTLAGLKIYEHELTAILTQIDLTGERAGGDMSEFVKLSDRYTGGL